MRLTQARCVARCRKALEDPLQAHRTVGKSHMAADFGLTHFYRKLKKYGLLPSEYRRFRKTTNKT